MSFATEITKRSIAYDILLRIGPRIQINNAGASANVTTTHLSGSVYYFTWPYSAMRPASMFSGQHKTSIAALTTQDDWFYDDALNRMYVYSSGFDMTVSNGPFYFDCEIYYSTRPCMWYRTPSDSTSDLVKWPANLTEPPSISIRADEQTYGLVNIDVQGFVAIFENDKFQKLINDRYVSMKNATVEIWHLAGRLQTGNFSKMFSGLLDDVIDTDLKTISFGLVQNFATFGQQLVTQTIDVSSDTDNWDPNADQTQIKLLIRNQVGDLVYNGRSGFPTAYAGLLPVNSTYNDQAPTTATNRTWVLAYDHSAGARYAVRLLVAGTAGSTNSKKIVAAGDDLLFTVGDWVDVLNGVTHHYVTVTAINTTTHEITFSATGGAGAVSIYREILSRNVYLVQAGVRYDLKPSRDYVWGTSVNFIQLTLTAACEANVGATTIDPTNGDYILVWPDAVQILKAQISGSDFPTAGDYANDTGIGALYHFLRYVVELTEAEINTQSFLDLDGVVSGDMPYWYPADFGGEMPTYREILAEWALYLKCIFYFDTEGLFTIKYIGDTGTSAGTITDNDIFEDTMRVSYSTMDVGVFVYHRLLGERALVSPYDIAAAADTATQYKEVDGYTTEIQVWDSTLNRIEGVKDVGQRQTADGLRTIRAARLSFQTTFAVADSQIGDTFTLSSKYLPGYDYDGDEHSADYVLLSIEKSIDGVMLTFTDTLGD